MRTLFLDSLTIAPALPSFLTSRAETPEVRVVDVGAGAGIPGLPLTIVFPWWSLTMIESVAKKARFLESAARGIGLSGVTVLPSRAEEVGRMRNWRDAADLCLARAVAPLASLLELCGPLTRPGGYLAFPKSGDLSSELQGAEAAMQAVRLELTRVVPVDEELGLGAERVIVLYRKSGSTPPGYPRRVGLAQSRPIGNQGLRKEL
jgi:16S rRNA (guanine527-N7)-methyltransferase